MRALRLGLVVAAWVAVRVALAAVLPPEARQFTVALMPDSGPRGYRDFVCRADLSQGAAVAFDFRCDTLAPVMGFTLHLKSGRGWYSGGFFPSVTGAWHRIVLPRARFVSEQQPAGWQMIDGVRLSVWRIGSGAVTCGLDALASSPACPSPATNDGASASRRVPYTLPWRAVWNAWDRLPCGAADWPAAARRLREAGFTAVLPNLARAGEIAPAAECLAACRAEGLECHIWKVCWRAGRGWEGSFPGGAQVSFVGRMEKRWMCPSDPRNLAAEIEACVRLAEAGPSGIHLDYIRYPDNGYCFCAGCRARFEQMCACTITNWPSDVRKQPALAAAWRRFRRANVTALVRGVAERLRRTCPGVQLSAAVVAQPATADATYAQEWVDWCREGLLDFVCPMDYWTVSPAAFAHVVSRQCEILRGAPVKLRPGIGLSCWRRTENDAARCAEEIGAVGACGLDGFAVFSADARFAAALPALQSLAPELRETNVVCTAGDDWIPLKGAREVEKGSALDFAQLAARPRPAGRFGWLRNVDGHFEFEGRPGVRQRFFGANLCGTAVTPTKDEADRLVVQLSRLGYNAVRIHHHEQALAGGADRPGNVYDPAALDRFDYLLSRCFAAGIYATVDLYVSRRVAWEEIGLAPRPGQPVVPPALYKSLVCVWEPAFTNWCAAAARFLDHVNPYTGRRYADEPAMPLMALVNEGQLTAGWQGARKAEDPALAAAWRDFLARRRTINPEFCATTPSDWQALVPNATNNAALVHFNAELERTTVRRMIDFLRARGVRALVTNQNCPPDTAPLHAVREALYDYVDNHFYVGHPQFSGGAWRLPSVGGSANPAATGAPMMCRTAFSRVAGKPFTVSEWNFAGPGRFRCAGGLMAGAFAAAQDWDGLWRFCYASSREQLSGARAPSYFPLVSDPVAMAAERACAALFWRGDFPAAVTSRTYRLGRAEMRETDGIIYQLAPPHWAVDVWSCRVALTACGGGSDDWTVLRRQRTPPFAPPDGTGSASDRVRGDFRVDTPRTAGGFSAGGRLATSRLVFHPGGRPAAVWATALDAAADLRTARRILVAHVTDCQGEGTVYADLTRRKLLRFGSSNVLVRAGSASIALTLDDPERYAVWALDASGVRRTRLPARATAHTLDFTAHVAGPDGARLYYEIVRLADR